MTIARNSKTSAFNRLNRFLIDDENSNPKLAYSLTKPFKLSNIYNGKGVFIYVLQEVQSTNMDNHALGIADYYKYFPAEPFISGNKAPIIDTNNTSDKTGKKVWL